MLFHWNTLEPLFYIRILILAWMEMRRWFEPCFLQPWMWWVTPHFIPAFLLDILSFLSAFVTACPFFAFLANSNTAFIAKGNNVFLRISRHILGLLRRTQNLLQLVEATATGDRCSIDTNDMTSPFFFNLVILLDYIFVIIFVTLDFTILYVAADISALQKRIIF